MHPRTLTRTSLRPKPLRFLGTLTAFLLSAHASPDLLAAPGDAPVPPESCEALVPGTPLPYPNPIAPERLTFPPDTTEVDLVILGHSENRGFDPYLQDLLDADPPLPGIQFRVTNRFRGGTLAWQWATPGQRGHSIIQQVLQDFGSAPLVVLGLFTNNTRFPIQTISEENANYNRFLDNLDTITDLVHDSGNGAQMIYLSAHRYKVTNEVPSWNENLAMEAVMNNAAAAGKSYVKPGPDQHDLHRCCFPACFATDRIHTNAAGDQLMAEAWYRFLVREMTGSAAVPYGSGTRGFGGTLPAIQPRGKAPRLGNLEFALRTVGAVPFANVGYFFGFEPTSSAPPLMVIPQSLKTGVAGLDGIHDLSLPVPERPQLEGMVIYVQSIMRDPAAPGGFAASQGLELRLGW